MAEDVQLSAGAQRNQCVVIDVSLTPQSEGISNSVTKFLTDLGLEAKAVKLQSFNKMDDKRIRESFVETLCVVFIMTGMPKRRLIQTIDGILQAVLQSVTVQRRILTVHGFPLDGVPQELKAYTTLRMDCREHQMFENQARKIIQGWFANSKLSVGASSVESKNSIHSQQTNGGNDGDMNAKETQTHDVDCTDGGHLRSSADKNNGGLSCHNQASLGFDEELQPVVTSNPSNPGANGIQPVPNSNEATPTDPQTYRTQVTSELKQSIKNQATELIVNSKSTWYDLYILLKNAGEKMNLHDLPKSSDGLNLLHVVVEQQRAELILSLMYVGLLEGYLQEPVSEHSPMNCRGFTAMQIAAAKSNRRLQSVLQTFETLVNSMSQFLKACHAGDLQLVRSLLESSNRVLNDLDSCGNNCLFWAIVSDNVDLFTYLLDNNANSAHLNKDNCSLLHVACILGHHRFISALITRCHLDVKALDAKKKVPLIYVAWNGDVESLRELLKHQPINRDVLPSAATHGRLALIKYVLEHVEPSVHIDFRDNSGRSALTTACLSGHGAVVAYLLGQGASHTVEDLRHRTPLHAACEKGHEDVVRMLLDNGANIDVQDRYSGSDLCVKVEGKIQGNPTWYFVEIQRSKAHIFMQSARQGITIDFSAYGTVHRSGQGKEPDKASADWIERFNSSRIPVSIESTPDLTPLHMAIFHEHPTVARVLVERGAKVNVQDSFGLTPFMLCAMRGDIKTASLLEQKGADTECKDNNGQTALDIAEANNQTAMINFIKGKEYIKKTEEYLHNSIGLVMSTLGGAQLEELRKGAKDVRRHLIDTVRGLTIDNNVLLMELGSGPVMQSSRREHSNPTASSSRQ